MTTRIPKNAIAIEISKKKSIILDIEEQKRVLTEMQAEYQETIDNLNSTGLAEWEELPDVVDSTNNET